MNNGPSLIEVITLKEHLMKEKEYIKREAALSVRQKDRIREIVQQIDRINKYLNSII